jgi:hypothetical protein
VLPYWSKAVRATLNEVPAVAVKVDGSTVKLLRAEVPRVMALLMALGELQLL